MQHARIARLADWARGRPRGPHTLEIGLTMACNADCVFCWRQHAEARVLGQNLPLARWQRLLEEARDLGVEYVRVIGEGEPTLHPDAVRVLLHVKRMGFRGFLCTNGTLLGRDDLQDLVHHGWDWINFSLEGPNAATHDGLTRTAGSFDALVGAAARIAKLKRALRTDRPGVNFGMALTTRNWRTVADVFPLAARLGVFAVNLEPVTVNSHESEPLKLTRVQAERFVAEIAPAAIAAGERLGVRTNLPELTVASILSTNQVHVPLLEAAEGAGGLLRAPCFNPFWFLHVRANGQVGSCGFWRPMHVADVRTQSLADAWWGDYYRDAREQLLGGRLFDPCPDCNLGFVADNLALRRDLATALAGG